MIIQGISPASPSPKADANTLADKANGLQGKVGTDFAQQLVTIRRAFDAQAIELVSGKALGKAAGDSVEPAPGNAVEDAAPKRLKTAPQRPSSDLPDHTSPLLLSRSNPDVGPGDGTTRPAVPDAMRKPEPVETSDDDRAATDTAPIGTAQTTALPAAPLIAAVVDNAGKPPVADTPGYKSASGDEILSTRSSSRVVRDAQAVSRGSEPALAAAPVADKALPANAPVAGPPAPVFSRLFAQATEAESARGKSAGSSEVQTAVTATLGTPASNGAPVTPAPMHNTQPQPMTASLNMPVGSGEWNQAITRQSLRLSHVEGGRAELNLHPRDLGQISVTLRMGEQAQLHFQSPHAHVRAAVESALPQLRQAFADSGIALGDASVSDQQPRDQPPRRQGGGQHLSTASDIDEGVRAVDTNSQALRGIIVAGRTLDGGIDIFA